MTEIHPSAVVHKDAELGKGVVIGPNCVVAEGVSIGDETVLCPNVVVEKNVKIGMGNRFFHNCVIGAWPQMLGLTDESEIGGLVIGDGNTLHEHVTVHPSIHADRETSIGNENFIMVGTHIGHDSFLEDKVVLSNGAQISGHCRIESGVWISGMVGLHQFVTLGKWSFVAGLAGLNKDIPPFMIVSGHYPPVVRGVNKRGMKRAGLSEEQQEKVFEAYRKLYRQNGALLENAQALIAGGELDENVRAIVDSIINSSKHQYGRYLETFR